VTLKLVGTDMSGDKEGGDRKGESGSQWKKLLHELV
jgi:hypothetical protein